MREDDFHREIAIRIPSWIDRGGFVAVNGKRLEVFAEPSSYLLVRRTWRSGDTITVHLPMTVREERLAGSSDTFAAMYGTTGASSYFGRWICLWTDEDHYGASYCTGRCWRSFGTSVRQDWFDLWRLA